jgi:hypothetical protein
LKPAPPPVIKTYKKSNTPVFNEIANFNKTSLNPVPPSTRKNFNEISSENLIYNQITKAVQNRRKSFKGSGSDSDSDSDSDWES